MKTTVSLPELKSLGSDLLETTSLQRWMALSRPFIGLATYIVAIYFNLWYITPVIVFLIFVSVVTVTHDVVHNSLGLSKSQSDVALFIMGAVLLESGHAYKMTHIQHHKLFPHEDDPEGEPAKIPLVKALLQGPVFLFKLYFWAVSKAGKGSQQLYWLYIEGLWLLLWIVIALLVLPYTFAVLWYVVMVIVGSWVYPLLTVHLPHYNYGDEPLYQTRSLRGRIIPALFLELTYHLEHHLYPQVPSHNLKKLSQRLDGFLKENNARVWHVL